MWKCNGNRCVYICDASIAYKFLFGMVRIWYSYQIYSFESIQTEIYLFINCLKAIRWLQPNWYTFNSDDTYLLKKEAFQWSNEKRKKKNCWWFQFLLKLIMNNSFKRFYIQISNAEGEQFFPPCSIYNVYNVSIDNGWKVFANYKIRSKSVNVLIFHGNIESNQLPYSSIHCYSLADIFIK